MRYLLFILVFVSNLCSAASGSILYWNAGSATNGACLHVQHKSKAPKLPFSQIENYIVSEDNNEDTLPDVESLALAHNTLAYRNNIVHAVANHAYTHFVQQCTLSIPEVPIYIRHRRLLI